MLNQSLSFHNWLFLIEIISNLTSHMYTSIMIIATRDNLHRYNYIRYFISKSVKITIAILRIRSDSSIDNIAFPPGNEFYQARLVVVGRWIFTRERERKRNIPRKMAVFHVSFDLHPHPRFFQCFTDFR